MPDWNLAGLLLPSDKPTSVLVILNQPLVPFEHFEKLWNNSRFHICADGGANLLYDALTNNPTIDIDRFLPSEIRGDLDSIRPEVREFFAGKVPVVHDSSQDSTDLEKCIDSLKQYNLPDSAPIVVLGAIGGRFDQTMASVNSVLRAQITSDRQIYMLSVGNLVLILRQGEHKIKCTRSLEGPHCGLIPFVPSRVSTTGIGWNLDNSLMEFGGLVSTSNRIEYSASDEIHAVLVTVHSGTIFWTCELAL